MPHTSAELATGIQDFLKRTNPTLFCGAGVGRRVGYPDWGEFVESLADACDSYEPEAASLIRARAAKGQLLAAASVFKTCDSIPTGERFRLLAAPFARTLTDEQQDLLTPLVGLPFTAAITTNYEHSLHSASAAERRGWISPVELGDVSMKGAALLSDYFVARIHGRAEHPQTMVVDAADYERVLADPLYLDFVLEIFKNRSCLFVGFSFVDPAIDHILRLFDARFSPNFPKIHTALIPAGAHELEARLRKLNIDPLVYSPEDGHADLWRAIRYTYDGAKASKTTSRRTTITTPPSASLHQYMAFAYAQVSCVSDRQPIAELVRDGIVWSLLPDNGTPIDDSEAAEQLRLTLHVSLEEAKILAGESLIRLVGRGHAARQGDMVGRSASVLATNIVNDALNELTEGVSNRVQVREKVKLTAEEKTVVQDTLEGLFIWRAWDLAAHFAGAGAGMSQDLPRVIGQIMQRERGKRIVRAPTAVEGAILDLLTSPEDRETQFLASLGRTAFGLQVVLATPRQGLFQRYALPQKIYLDSNVVMPAITEGHPLRPVYAEALTRLAEASQAHGATLRVVVGKQFLNEIVSHRKASIDLVKELDLEDPERLRGHIMFYSATNTNVFVGAYAAFVGRSDNRISFGEFLADVAPYSSEEALAEHLKRMGIATEQMAVPTGRDSLYITLFNGLLTGYEREVAADESLKGKILIQHEAQQLARLHLDAHGSLRTVFVTADNKLRRIMQREPEFRLLAGSTVTAEGLVAIVDVMVGLKADTRSMARLLWGAPHTETEQALFNYFVGLALRHYDEAMAMEMQEAARRVSAEARAEASDKHLNLFGRSTQDVATTAKFLDRYEDRFFQFMREAIERRENALD